MSDDSDPLFLSEFYGNLKILSQDLYKKSSAPVPSIQQSIDQPMISPRDRAGATNKSYLSLGKLSATKAGVEEGKDMNQDYFSDENITERLKIYAAKSGVPQEYLDRYVQNKKSEGSS